MKNKEKSAKQSPAKIVKVKDLTAKKDVKGGKGKAPHNPADN